MDQSIYACHWQTNIASIVKFLSSYGECYQLKQKVNLKGWVFSTIVAGASLFLEGDYRHKSRRYSGLPRQVRAVRRDGNFICVPVKM